DLAVDLGVPAHARHAVRDDLLDERGRVLDAVHSQTTTQFAVDSHAVGDAATGPVRMPRLADKRLVEVAMGVNEPGQRETAVTVLDPVAGFGLDVRLDVCDASAFDEHVLHRVIDARQTHAGDKQT